MKITEIQLTETSEGLSEVSASVQVMKPHPESYRIWFRGPRGCFGDAPLGDIYFSAFWVPAMFLQEEFYLEGDISKELLDAAYEKLEPLFLEAHAGILAAARVRGHRVVESATPPSPGRGCLYSGGVDSSYSVVKNLDSLSHLVFIQGFEISWRRDDLLEQALGFLRGGAKALDKELVVLKSNLQDPIQDLTIRSGELGRSTPAFALKLYFGSMLVSLSMCLRGILGQVAIPSSWGEDSSSVLGSNPKIEPNWSTSTMSFDLDGGESDRIDKLSHIFRLSPKVFEWLRVCIFPQGNGCINCGRCAKCLRTMMEMRIAGAGEKAYSSFEVPLDLELAKRTDFKTDGGLMGDLARRAREAGDSEIIRTTEIILGERFYWPRFRAVILQKWRTRRKMSRAKARARRKAERRGRRNPAPG